MTALSASAAEPRHISGGAGSAGRGHSVKVPLRLAVGAQYGDAALSVYVKIAALALRKELCTAKVVTLAAYLGMSKSAVERALKQLTRPDTVDGLVEAPTRRRTYEDGRGQSAERTVRPLDPGELWVRIPVRAAEALTPRLLRLYALLAYADARRVPVTVVELAEMLYHHSGGKAGEHLSERQVRRLVDELDATGWLTVHRREGRHGRHAYETHSHPLRTVPAAAPVQEPAGTGQLSLWESAAPVIHDGSGPGDHDGSLASKEDLPTDRPENTQLVGGSRRRRDTGSQPAVPASDLAGGTFGPGASRAPRGNRTTPSQPYNGPELRWTARIRDALAPVAAELDGINRYLLRKIARQVAAELDARTASSSSERIADRLSRRLRPVMREDIRDWGAWLLAVGLPRKGCTDPACEDGTLWPDDEPCMNCAYTREMTRDRWRQAREQQDRLTELRARKTGAETPEDVERHEGYAAWTRRLSEQEAEWRGQAGAERARVLEGLGTDGVLPAPGGEVRWEPGPEWPAKASYRQRTAVSDEALTAAIGELGPAVTLHVYGHLRVAPLLRHLGHDLPVLVPVPAQAVVEERPIPGRMPPELRAAAVRKPSGHALASACPTCRAAAGHTCVTPKGRRPRPPHRARTDAPPAAPQLAAASGEDTA